MPDQEVSPAPPIESVPPDWSRIDADILCPLCGYNLRGLIEARCPECGYRFEWSEALDPSHRLHPFLFEQHPEKNFRSFWRTTFAAFRPIRFWRRLHPAQSLRPRRLVAFALIGQLLFLVGMATIPCALIYNALRWDREAYVAAINRIVNKLTPEQREAAIQKHGSLQAFLATQRKAPTLSSACFEVQVVYRPHWRLLAFAAMPLLWPWVTFAVLRLVWVNKPLAKVAPTHVLRCVLYSLDFGSWAGVLMALAVVPTVLLTPGMRLEELLLPTVGWILLLGWIAGVVRLYAAYRFYIHFPRPLRLVLTSQFVVFLTVFLLYVLLEAVLPLSTRIRL